MTPPITLHWFLPTNGDSRQLVGGGHGLGTRCLRRRGLWAPAAESVAGSARTAAFARLEGSR